MVARKLSGSKSRFLLVNVAGDAIPVSDLYSYTPLDIDRIMIIEDVQFCS
jgi:hypothetical protein